LKRHGNTRFGSIPAKWVSQGFGRVTILTFHFSHVNVLSFLRIQNLAFSKVISRYFCTNKKVASTANWAHKTANFLEGFE